MADDLNANDASAKMATEKKAETIEGNGNKQYNIGVKNGFDLQSNGGHIASVEERSGEDGTSAGDEQDDALIAEIDRMKAILKGKEDAEQLKIVEEFSLITEKMKEEHQREIEELKRTLEENYNQQVLNLSEELRDHYQNDMDEKTRKVEEEWEQEFTNQKIEKDRQISAVQKEQWTQCQEAIERVTLDAEDQLTSMKNAYERKVTEYKQRIEELLEKEAVSEVKEKEFEETKNKKVDEQSDKIRLLEKQLSEEKLGTKAHIEGVEEKIKEMECSHKQEMDSLKTELERRYENEMKERKVEMKAKYQDELDEKVARVEGYLRENYEAELKKTREELQESCSTLKMKYEKEVCEISAQLEDAHEKNLEHELHETKLKKAYKNIEEELKKMKEKMAHENGETVGDLEADIQRKDAEISKLVAKLKEQEDIIVKGVVEVTKMSELATVMQDKEQEVIELRRKNKQQQMIITDQLLTIKDIEATSTKQELEIANLIMQSQGKECSNGPLEEKVTQLEEEIMKYKERVSELEEEADDHFQSNVCQTCQNGGEGSELIMARAKVLVQKIENESNQKVEMLKKEIVNNEEEFKKERKKIQETVRKLENDLEAEKRRNVDENNNLIRREKEENIEKIKQEYERLLIKLKSEVLEKDGELSKTVEEYKDNVLRLKESLKEEQGRCKEISEIAKEQRMKYEERMEVLENRNERLLIELKGNENNVGLAENLRKENTSLQSMVKELEEMIVINNEKHEEDTARLHEIIRSNQCLLKNLEEVNGELEKKNKVIKLELIKYDEKQAKYEEKIKEKSDSFELERSLILENSLEEKEGLMSQINHLEDLCLKSYVFLDKDNHTLQLLTDDFDKTDFNTSHLKDCQWDSDDLHGYDKDLQVIYGPQWISDPSRERDKNEDMQGYEMISSDHELQEGALKDRNERLENELNEIKSKVKKGEMETRELEKSLTTTLMKLELMKNEQNRLNKEQEQTIDDSNEMIENLVKYEENIKDLEKKNVRLQKEKDILVKCLRKAENHCNSSYSNDREDGTVKYWQGTVNNVQIPGENYVHNMINHHESKTDTTKPTTLQRSDQIRINDGVKEMYHTPPYKHQTRYGAVKSHPKVGSPSNLTMVIHSKTGDNLTNTTDDSKSITQTPLNVSKWSSNHAGSHSFRTSTTLDTYQPLKLAPNLLGLSPIVSPYERSRYKELRDMQGEMKSNHSLFAYNDDGLTILRKIEGVDEQESVKNYSIWINDNEIERIGAANKLSSKGDIKESAQPYNTFNREIKDTRMKQKYTNEKYPHERDRHYKNELRNSMAENATDWFSSLLDFNDTDTMILTNADPMCLPRRRNIRGNTSYKFKEQAEMQGASYEEKKGENKEEYSKAKDSTRDSLVGNWKNKASEVNPERFSLTPKQVHTQNAYSKNKKTGGVMEANVEPSFMMTKNKVKTPRLSSQRSPSYQKTPYSKLPHSRSKSADARLFSPVEDDTAPLKSMVNHDQPLVINFEDYVFRYRIKSSENIAILRDPSPAELWVV